MNGDPVACSGLCNSWPLLGALLFAACPPPNPAAPCQQVGDCATGQRCDTVRGYCAPAISSDAAGGDDHRPLEDGAARDAGAVGDAAHDAATVPDGAYDAATVPDGAYDAGPDATGWWNAAWQWRQQLRFDNRAQVEPLLDFPVLVALDPARFDYAHALPGGADLRFIDAIGSTFLDYQIEHWDSGAVSHLWVKVPQIDAATDGDSIWLYYGNPNAAAGAHPDVTWSAGFEGVFHLNEGLGDSSPLPYDAIDQGALAAAGWIAGGRAFNGYGDWLGLGLGRDWLRDTGAATLSAWIRPESVGGFHSIVAIAVSNGGTATGNSRAYIEISQGALAIGGRGSDLDSEQRLVSNMNSVGPGSWHHVAGVFDYTAGTGQIYLDGSLDDEGALAFDQQRTADSPATNGAIGAQDDGTMYFFDGLIDEVRIARVARSASWIAAEHANQSDRSDTGFVRFGSAQSR